jgi:hypothetical protein
MGQPHRLWCLIETPSATNPAEYGGIIREWCGRQLGAHCARGGRQYRHAYRHFPTRDELISAVYQQEVDMLIEAADQLMTEREPATALREWLMLFVDFLDAKYGMAEATDTLIDGPEPLYSRTPHRLDVPIKRWSPAGSGLEPFGTTSSRTICSVPSLVWHTLDQQELEAVGSSDGRSSAERHAVNSARPYDAAQSMTRPACPTSGG